MFYDTIKLHFLPRVGNARTCVDLTPTPVNVFVGPNGAGKSLALRELVNFPDDRKIVCTRSATRGVLREAQEWSDRENIHKDIDAAKIAGLPQEWHSNLCAFELPRFGLTVEMGRDEWFMAYIEIKERLRHLENHRVVLSAFESLGQVAVGRRGRFKSTPASRLDALYRNQHTLGLLRNIIFDNFGLYPVIDALRGDLALRLSRQRPPDGLEQKISPETEAFMDRTIAPDDLSDGTRTYLGLWAHLLSGDERLIFLDEAGSMLHPPLARLLGKHLANVAVERNGQLFAATHSADFLLGCIQAGCKVNVIRLTYSDGVSTARILSAEDLRPLMHDPLLRSANVLSGLFHDGVVVCEADADRAFYQEVNERLIDSREGMPSCHFVNAQNWQTIPRITGILRGLGIPAAMLIDLDVVIHSDMVRLLERAGVPMPIVHGLGQLRGELGREFSNKERRDQLKREGLATVAKEMLPSWRKYLRDLAEYGIFAVPVGELEGWLPQLGVPRGHKGQWIVKTFNGMGSSPEDPDYLRPEDGGPWEFMRSVAKWIHNPERLGMPALP